LGEVCFQSATCRLFRAAALECSQENYGQSAIYLGSIAEHPDRLRLDSQQTFDTGQETPISGNTAEILSSTRFSDHFRLVGDKTQHLGSFSDNSVSELFSASERPSSGSSCC
jgi:arsenite methyltransferase